MIAETVDLQKIIWKIKTEQPAVLYGVNWDDYFDYVNATLNESPYKMTYNHGVLKVMVLALKHENISRFIEKIMMVVGLTLRKEIISAGSMSLVSKRLHKGADPDESYYIQNAHLANIKDKLFDDATDTPPDLVVEIDHSRGSDDKFEIYAAFGIKEFWLYSQEKLRIFNLTETGEYLEAEKSAALPILTARDSDRVYQPRSTGRAIQGFRRLSKLAR